MSSLDHVSIREMTSADISAGLALCRASRWNQTERDWRHFLVAAPQGALVAVENGSVVGTVATLPYGPFTWISMVLVDPVARGRGIGTLLLNQGLELVPRGSVARLDATPAGEVIYRKLGFVGEYGLARLFLDASSRRGTRTTGVRPLARSDWGALLATDAPEYALVDEHQGRVRGYLLGRHGHVREHLGPLVADSDETAARLLDACLTANADRRVFIDVPDEQRAFRDTLAGLGFAIERPFLRMRRGSLAAAGQPPQVYAITGPEFG